MEQHFISFFKLEVQLFISSVVTAAQQDGSKFSLRQEVHELRAGSCPGPWKCSALCIFTVRMTDSTWPPTLTNGVGSHRALGTGVHTVNNGSAVKIRVNNLTEAKTHQRNYSRKWCQSDVTDLWMTCSCATTEKQIVTPPNSTTDLLCLLIAAGSLSVDLHFINLCFHLLCPGGGGLWVNGSHFQMTKQKFND